MTEPLYDIAEPAYVCEDIHTWEIIPSTYAPLPQAEATTTFDWE